MKYDPEKIARDLCKKLPLQPSLPGMKKEAKKTAYSIIYEVLHQFDFVDGESREDVYDQGYEAGYEASEDGSLDCDFCEAKQISYEEGHEEGYEEGHEKGFEDGKEAWKRIVIKL